MTDPNPANPPAPAPALQSPLHHRFADSDALLLPYGPPAAPIDVVGAFEEVGLEYAALRKAAVLFDEPHTAALILRGPDRLAFLNNMLTQKVIDLSAGQTRPSFWLNRKGRIDADLRVIERGDHTVLLLDRHLAGSTADSLNTYLFSEDCTIESAADTHHTIALHGVGALAVLAARASDPALAELAPDTNAACTIEGASCIADRDDLTGDSGVRLLVPREHAERVYDALLAPAPGVPTVKPSGWYALNTARIEAGRPLFNIDFGPDTLPAETSLQDSRIDFRKGCYLGQEVVARMDARKARKQGLAAIRVDTTDPNAEPLLPGMGDRVFLPADPEGNPIGVVTSSTISPMLSAAAIAFAMLRDAETAPGTPLLTQAEGRKAPATVQPALAFWKR
jgi:folate-binding protein YgfZ